MLARLGSKLVDHAALVGVSALAAAVLGGATGAFTLVDHPSATPAVPASPPTAHNQRADHNKAAEPAETPEAPDAAAGTRPTDTHGFCVSQVAKNAPTTHSGTGADAVTHGSLVSAAAGTCGQATRSHGRSAEQRAAHGKH